MVEESCRFTCINLPYTDVIRILKAGPPTRGQQRLRTAEGEGFFKKPAENVRDSGQSLSGFWMEGWCDIYWIICFCFISDGESERKKYGNRWIRADLFLEELGADGFHYKADFIYFFVCDKNDIIKNPEAFKKAFERQGMVIPDRPFFFN